MKKLLLGCVLLLAGMFSVARADNDTLYVRELTYQTLAFTGDTARTSDSLTISSTVLKDKRVGCYAKGYSFTLTDSALVNIYVDNTTSWDGYLFLLSSDFQEIASNDDDCDGSCLTGLLLEAGTYNVLVTGYGFFDHGSFDLVISKRIIPVAQTLTYTPMTFGQMLVDSLTEQSPLMLWVDNMLCFAKGYSITLTETAIVDMFLSADDDVEPDGEVPLPSVDAYFNDAHYIMDIPAGITHHVLEAGTHYIVVLYNYVEGEFSNAFRLSASLLNHPTVTPATLTYQPIALNQLAVDSLVEACPVLLSPRSRAGCYAKGYSFTATAGKVYSIAMPDSLTDFDSYLLLYDANNNLVDMNDDAHGGNKSLIVAELEAGTYHVVVTSYSAMEEGSYGLIITENTLQTYYVDPVAGNDENDGSTPALAKKDLQSAIGNADFMGVFYLMNDDTISATASVPIPMKKAYGGASIVHIYPYQRDIHFYGHRAAVRPNPGDDGGTVETPFNMFQADLFELGNPNDNYKIIFDSVNMPVHIVKGEDVRFNNVTVSNSSIASLTYRAGKFSMKNCVIANDTLSDSFISGYDVTLTGCTIDGNASEGIISVYSNDEEINGRLVVENTSIQNNRGDTPTLILYEANAELRSGTFNNNTCTIDTEHMPASVVEAFGMLSARNMGGIMAAYASTVSFGSAFSYDSEAFIILADSMSTVAVTENLSGSYAVLPFSMSESNGGTDYTLGFAEGRRVLSGTDAMMQANYSHFAVPQLTDVQWYVHPDGRIYSQRAGIEDASETMAISLYPNPAQYHLNIAGVEEGSMVRILDINGRMVSSTAVSGATSTLNVSGLAAGIYFVQVVKGNTSATAKFIKQ